MYDNLFRLVTNFSIIIYARLSKEESGKSKEEQSKSIKNQIEICKRYIEDERKRYPTCKFEIVAILKDDGISGTTFERADFKKLLNLITEKKANMVITTDLSRLGRNHIKTDDFIEEWFPEHNVRYVSIIESVDTYTDCMSNDIAPIINWSNEHFAKLTSKKIKERFQLLRKDGKWTGGEPPYGYKLDKSNKYHFIVDGDTKEVVKRIFDLFINGNSISSIAKLLTDEKVPLPSIKKGYKRNYDQSLKGFWKESTIKNILKNEMYCGHMIQGKTTRLNHKSHKIIYLPSEAWIKIENTHEPIISEEKFMIVQNILKNNKNKTKNSYDYLLKGLLKCRECHHSIGIQHFNKSGKNYTVCNYYRKYGIKKDVCTSHRFIYENIEKTVLERIKDDCLKYIDIRSLEEKMKNYCSQKNSKDNFESRIEECKNNIHRLERQLDRLYEDRLDDIICEEQYKRISENKNDSLQYLRRELDRLVEEQKSDKKDECNSFLEVIETMLVKPNRVLITSLVDFIEIGERGDITIYYKICNPKNFKNLER